MKFFQSSSCELLPKHQVGIMLLRGVAGLGLMAWSFALLPVTPMPGFIVMGIAVLLLKGCPACWGMHMVNTVRGAASKNNGPAKPLLAEEVSPRQPYTPRDMSEHLFPPEDVERFRRLRQAEQQVAIPSASTDQNKAQA